MLEIQRASVRLLRRRPFYGQLLLGVRRQSGESTGLGFGPQGPFLRIHPQSFDLYTPLEQEALLEHLLRHLIHLHPLRRGTRETSRWDLACDLAVNPHLEHLPHRAALPERFGLPEDLAAERYYELLLPSIQTGNQKGAGRGRENRLSGERDRGAPDDAAALLDDHKLWRAAEGLSESLIRSLAREQVRRRP